MNWTNLFINVTVILVKDLDPSCHSMHAPSSQFSPHPEVTTDLLSVTVP